MYSLSSKVKIISFLITAIIFISTKSLASEKPVAIVIHGGAGAMIKGKMTNEREQQFKAKLKEAIEAGHKILKQGGSSLKAVTQAITIMENSPLFNAGKGAVFNHDKKNEMDASIMDGKALNAGSVAGVMHVKNPILLAYEIMEHSDHVMLAGEGAEVFARTRNIKLVEPDYFYTNRRWEQIQRILKKTSGTKKLSISDSEYWQDYKFGTVGAVALDKNGNIAAGTSTGGMTNKKWGRIGDSPIIGAGTYANNNSCGISATGHGEFFIRRVVAYDICALVEYKGISIQKAAEEVVMKKLLNMKGKGGVIGLDKHGNIIEVFNTSGMFRAKIDTDGTYSSGIYKD